jgi:hypothetical protein
MDEQVSNQNPSKEQIEAKIKLRIKQAKTDPIIFIDRFFYIFNPKTAPYHFEFRLRDYQRDIVVPELRAAIEQGYDLFFDKSREMGATYTTLGVFLWFWRYIDGSNFLLGSRKEDYVDNRGTKQTSGETINKEESLFGKLEYMLRKLPTFMLPTGFDFRKHLSFMSLINPELGNVISGESSNPNFSRGGRFKATLYDEFAFWESDTEAWGAGADTTNCRIVLTTPGIRPNTKAKRLRFGDDGEQIKVIELDASLDKTKDAAYHQRERIRRSAEDYAREILRNWETSIKGRVYPEIQYAAVGDFPYVPSWPLLVSWDFGLDGTAIQVWQVNIENGKPRLIDSFHTAEEPIQFFFPLFGAPVDSMFDYTSDDLAAVQDFKNYKKAIHFGDPDVSKRGYTSKVKTSARKELENIGIYIQTKPQSNSFIERREATKVLLQQGIEVNDTERNKDFLTSIKESRYPQRLDTSQATTAIVLPIHNWASHHRTALEYFAVNYEPKEVYGIEPTAPGWYNKEQDYNQSEKAPAWYRRSADTNRKYGR